MKSKFLLSIFLLLGGLAAPALAQTVNPTRGVYFRTIGVGVNSTELFYQDGAKPKPITIDSERRSAYFEYKGGAAPLVFVRQQTTADGKKIDVPVAQITLDPSAKRVLLIFHKLPSETEKLGVVPLADDARAVPPGGYRFVNFLPIQVGIILGGKKQLMAPHASYVTEFPTDAKGSVQPFKIYVITGDSAIPVYSNVWAPNPSKRGLVLMVPNRATTSGVDVKYLSESVTMIPADEPTPSP